MLFLRVALSWGLYFAIFLVSFSWISYLFSFFWGCCVIIFILRSRTSFTNIEFSDASRIPEANLSHL